MRLTLRTLLAYLDDTLEPAEARLIGQKVAESDTAQELITRIKEVTRRRRLTTPQDAPGSKVDPNSIAEYLDNELSAEALAEIEQVALASDVHLAELAACHQILTVVLGEPATVPPTAFQRMYGLVKSPESNPRHQPPRRREAEEGLNEGREVDESLRLGLPAMHSGSWTNRLILIGGAACVLLLLIVAIWQVLPSRLREGEPDQVAKSTAKAPLNPIVEIKDKPAAKIEPEPPTKKEPEPQDKQPDKDKLPAPKKEPEVKDKPADIKDKKGDDDTPAAPNPAVAFIGNFEPAKRDAAVLLQLLPDKKQPDQKQWTRLVRSNDPNSSKVLTNAPLVSLPGYRSFIQLDSGIQLTLWGNVPEISFFPVAIESVVNLHPNDQFDLDLTLVRGRIALTNSKGQPVKTRLRFANPAKVDKGEIWDITLLEKGTEVIVNLAGMMPPGEPFYPKKDNSGRLGPVAVVVMVVHTGSATLKVDLQPEEKLSPPPAGPLVLWDSRGGKLNMLKAEAMPPWVQPLPPLPKEADTKQIAAARAAVLAALDGLSTDLTGGPVDVGFVNATKTNDVQKRRLVVRSAAAIDDLQRVIEALEDKEVEVRRAAVETLRIWIGAGRDNDYVLFNQLQPAMSANDAEIVMTLLHSFAPQQEADPSIRSLLVNYLTHKKIAVRELSHDYLLRLFPSGRSIGYNPLAPEAQVRQAAQQWQALIEKAKK